MTGNRVAYRYANALFILSGEMKKTETVFSNLQFVLKCLLNNNQLLVVLENPVLDAAKKYSVLKEIFSSHVSTVVNEFMSFLSQKGRLNLLVDICKEFIAIYKQAEGIIEAEVYSAVALEKNQEKQIQNFLASQTNMNVALNLKVDRSLIGGFAVRIADTYYDNSVRSKLKKLSKTLINEQ